MSDSSLVDNSRRALYRNILVATGGGAHSQAAVERAVALAKHYGAALHVVAVVTPNRNALLSTAAASPAGAILDVQAQRDQAHSHEEVLRQTANAARAEGLNVVEHLSAALKPADAILSVAAETGADLIVLGRRHKSAWSAALAGSVADMVSHASPVDVLIAR